MTRTAVAGKFDRTSVLRNIGNKPVALLVFCLSVAYSLFHLYITYNPMPELLQRSAHVAIGLCLIFFYIRPEERQPSGQPVDWILVLASAASFGYLAVEYQAIVTTRGGIPNTLDIVFDSDCYLGG